MAGLWSCLTFRWGNTIDVSDAFFLTDFFFKFCAFLKTCPDCKFARRSTAPPKRNVWQQRRPRLDLMILAN